MHRLKANITIPVKYVDKNGKPQSVDAEVDAEWDHEIKDWLLSGEALRKLDEVKARHMFDECATCPECNIEACLLKGKRKLKRWGKRAVKKLKG